MTEFETTFRSKEAVEILTRLYVSLKLVKVFEPNNDNILGQIAALDGLLQKHLQREGEVRIRLVQNYLFLGRLRLKFDYSNYHVYKFFVEEFMARELGAVQFAPGLGREELRRFVFFLAGSRPARDDPFDRFHSDFQAEAFDHISLDRVEYAEDEKTRQRNAAKMYFMGIRHLHDVFDNAAAFRTVHVTKRWIQAMFNQLSVDEAFVYGLTNIKNYDEYTLNHSVNVCLLSVALGRRLGLSRPDLAELGVSAFFHDFGKLDIPTEILNKPAALNPEERAVMEQHAHLGAEKLIEIQKTRNIPLPAIQVALEHHLKPDLTGYPFILRKKSLSVFSKIVKVVDYFDAITTKRVYRPKTFSRENALAFMLEKSGVEFDPLILKAFIAMIGIWPIGSLVALDTGEIGIVAESNPHVSLAERPKVKLIADPAGNKYDGPVVDLTDVDPSTRRFVRTIVKTLDPETYGIRVADYVLARIQ